MNNLIKPFKAVCVVFLVIMAIAILSPRAVEAQQTYWLGMRDATNDWNTACNWDYDSAGSCISTPDNSGPQTEIADGGTASITTILNNPTIDEIDIGMGDYGTNVDEVLQTDGSLDVNSWFNLGSNNSIDGNGKADGNGIYNLQGGVMYHTGGGNFEVSHGGTGFGILTVEGTGVCTNDTGTISVGDTDTNQLNSINVLDNGLFIVNSGDFAIGENGGFGALNISGAGAVQVKASDFFGVGHDGSGSVGIINISSNGILQVSGGPSFYIADAANSAGEVNLNGGAIVWTGGRDINMADSVGSTGIVTIASGSFVNITGGTFHIGNSGVATLSQSGGVFTNTGGDVHVADGGRGTWNITGGVAKANYIHVGNAGVIGGTLNMGGTGLLQTVQTIEMGAGGTGTNMINLNGGTLAANGIVSDANGTTNIINLNGGTLEAVANNGNFFNGSNGKGLAVHVLAGGGIFNADGYNITVANNLSGTGGLANAGISGTVTISGANTYTGPTLVEAGELLGSTPGSCESDLTVANNATNGVQVNTPGAQWTAGGLTYDAGSTYVVFNFGANAPSATTAPMEINGNLVFNGAPNVIIEGAAVTSVGTYPLIKYTGTLSGTPPTMPILLPASVLSATILNDTANNSIDLQVVSVTSGPITFLPATTGGIVGSNGVATLTIPAAATVNGPLNITLTSSDSGVTASQTVTLPQGVTSTNLTFPILAVGVSTVTASGNGVTPATVQVTGTLPSISLPTEAGAIVGSNILVNLALTNAFPFSGPYVITLTSGNTAVTADQSVNVPAGVSNIDISLPISGVGVSTVTAAGTGLNPTSIQITGALPSINLPQSTGAAIGSDATATLTLTSPFPFSGPYTVSLTSGDTAVTASQTITIPAGTNSINLSFPIVSSGQSVVTATGPGLNPAMITVADTATLLNLGIANQWVGDDYVADSIANGGDGNWVDRISGAVASLDGGATPPVTLSNIFGVHAGVERDPNGGDTGFLIPGSNSPTGCTNYTVVVVLYSAYNGPSGANYYQDQLIMGYDIGGSGQTDWGMSWGGATHNGAAVVAGIGLANGNDQGLQSSAPLNQTHAIAMQTSGNNTFSLYADGVLMDQATNLVLHAPTNTMGLYIPLLSDVDANNEFIGNIFTNAIAEVRIYTNAQVNAASLTAYLQSYYQAFTISFDTNAVSAPIGLKAQATLTVPESVVATNEVTITLTSANAGVTASQVVTLPVGVNTTNISFTISAAGSSIVTASGVTPAGLTLIGTTIDVNGIATTVWSGAANNIWDINTTANWTQNNTPCAYVDGSPVIFTDSGLNTDINLIATVSPESVTVSNDVESYTFTGDGGIAGTADLVKEGSASLTINNGNTYTGSTIISNGAIELTAPAAIPSGTVAYYTFDNASDLGADSSGEGNTLVTATGAPVFSADGVSGGALYLNGSSTLNVGGEFPAGVPTGNNPYTIAIWERADVGCSPHGGFIGWGTGANSDNNIRLNGANSIVTYWFANDYTINGLTANPIDGNWHAIVVTWDGTNQIVYVDGTNVGSRVPTTLPTIGAANFVVGATTSDADFIGWLDNLLVADRALTPTEVSAYYQDIGALPGTTDVAIHGDGVLALNGNNQSIGSLAGEVGTSVTLGGGTLTAGADNLSTVFSGVISGSGSLDKAGTGTLTLANPNTYTSGTIAGAGVLNVQADGGLGSGNVSVESGASLELQSGVANTYISSTATLSLTSPSTVNLAFVGTDTISNLVIDGVTQAVGTWGSSSSGAANVDDIHFTGTGKLNVTSGTAGAPPSPVILPVYLDATGHNLVFRAATVIGYNYLLESTTNLTPPIVWSTNSSTAGTGETITNTAPIGSVEHQMFFRYLVQ